MPPDRCPVCLSACPFCPVCLSVTLVYCIQTVGGSNETWHGGRPLPGHIVSDGDAVPSEGYSPTFRPHVCCGQMAGWIKVSLGTEIDLEPGDIVLDGDHLPPPKKWGITDRTYRPTYCGRTAGRINMSLGAEIGYGPGNTVLDGDPASPPERGTATPSFWSMFIVAKWSPISPTAKHNCQD